MAFGFKMKTVKFQQAYTLEQLYEAIKDTEFAAGKPGLVKHGLATIIAFPALDSHNQVQIISTSMKKESNSYRVMKAEAAGVSNAVGNMAIDKITDGLFGLRSVMGKSAKKIEQLVEDTAEQLGKMGL